MSTDEIKLSPEELERVQGIIGQAYTDMEEVALGIGGHSGSVMSAYRGSGSARAMETYEDLGRAGRALADALDGLSRDVGLTSQTGRETDIEAQAAVNRAGTGAAAPADLGIAQAI
ncbi:hypothetical protein GCM10009716_34150 [Streptomyces sodiiphilus]|uniref:WXG100 family type VII secretion target n=1 Tax=Streptomyces sodiiphilus TaxID=226217 RepID=A0ABN2PIL9_9ACTN